MTNDIDIFIHSDSERLIKRIEELEKENAELKEKLKGFENGEVVFVGHYEAVKSYPILKERFAELKEQVEDWKADHEHNLELMKGLNGKIAELKEQIEKMKCCANCKYENKSSYKHECLHTSKRCAGYENWELAE